MHLTPSTVTIAPSEGITRWQTPGVLEALQTRRVVILEGARQCGKTTLAKSLKTAPGAIYRTLDDVALHAAARADPHGFVAHGAGLMVIDEIQRAPELLQAIKKEVDENPVPGRFLLTGSASIQSSPGVTESLAGRVAHQRLRPFAAGEMAGGAPTFLARALREDWSGLASGFTAMPGATSRSVPGSEPDAAAPVSGKDAVLLQALRGGYPEVQSLSDKAVRRWHQDYVAALMARDLQDIAHIRRKDSMHKLLEVLAAWSGKLMDISAIGGQLALSRPTLETYINALQTLFLVERVRPWAKTDYDRVSKQDKLFMLDTGLAASLLRWQFDKVRLDADLSGKLVEGFVFTQLSAQLDAQDEPCHLTHYRDREQREIDFVIETPDGVTVGVEVKAGSAVGLDSFKHLVWFRERMLQNKAPFVGVVLYTGEQVLRFGEQLWAVPLHALWGQ
ncbi:MAG: ATP-binding protein [Rhodoferax sp.]|nr:ATP-binding protein [Rhodoferax sp.]MBP9060842.1 ATP-binding protein [Rhodoferax sp.]MBP9686055.1 ATP-binding protein [Rhodoferax sp.]